jgi:protein ImuB
MLWLAIHFPNLPLESILRASSSADEPYVVLDAQIVVAANEAARGRGIRQGMRLAAAYALSPDLQACRRNSEAERETLEAAALWAVQFTPSVAIKGDAQLVFEIEGSLKLFGGLESILARVRAGLAALGLSGVVASAPTACGARCLASAGKECHVDDQPQLVQTLGHLPVSVLAVDEKAMTMLAAIGVRTIADMDALPRAGFARRFGPGLLKQIDQALGRCAETHDFFIPPQHFQARLELPHSTEAAEALSFAAKRLFVQLEAFLRARAGAAERISLRLEHEDLPQTELSIHFVAASRSAEHFASLARERFARLALPAPVQAISLDVPEVRPFAMHDGSLFPDATSNPEDWHRLLERLQARLGALAVQGIATADDHRPERAWTSVQIDARISGRASAKPRHLKAAEDQGTQTSNRRPLWLLREPAAIAESNGRLLIDSSPGFHGVLTLLAGPERIESGWWDGEDIARDYFIAQSEDHSLLWIYCQRGIEARWFLHGIFA